jgi:hypothetical protein
MSDKLPEPCERGEYFLSSHGKICKSGSEPGAWFICGYDFPDQLKLEGNRYRHFSSPEEALFAIAMWCEAGSPGLVTEETKLTELLDAARGLLDAPHPADEERFEEFIRLRAAVASFDSE